MGNDTSERKNAPAVEGGERAGVVPQANSLSAALSAATQSIAAGGPPMLPPSQPQSLTPPATATAKLTPSGMPPPFMPATTTPLKASRPAVPPAIAPSAPVEPAPPVARRPAKRRPAGPARATIAANDDIPTIGALIYALEQKPSRQPFKMAAIASAVWAAMSLTFGGVLLAEQAAKSASLWEMLAQPVLLAMGATIVLPIAIFYFLAMLVWRAQELKLMSSAMTEVAVRLAEPDRNAEQSVTSLGQTVRKQVNFMNEAVTQAINRAGELEAIVHSEVSNLERSFEENEKRIRNVLAELASERTQLVSTSTDVHSTLRAMGDEVPALIEKLNGQQGKLARIIENAGQNLIALEGSLLKASDRLEGSLLTVSDKIEGTLSDRTGHLQQVLDEYTTAINATLGHRTNEMQTVFEEYTRALDATLVERTRALDGAFAERVRLFDDAIHQSTSTIDETLMHGIDAVRRSSENITRHSVKAIEGLSGQADMLRNVSENLLTQIGGVTNRFENQGQSIMRAANALETANFRIDSTLQQRHQALNETLQKLTGKANELDNAMLGYSSNIEGTMSAAELRARSLTEDLSRSAESHARTTLAELERMRIETEAQASRTLNAMHTQFSTVGREMSTQMGSLSSRLSETSEDLRLKTQRAATDLMAEHERLRAEADRLPAATREGTDAMRRVLQEQIRALDRLSSLSNREVTRRDVTPPTRMALAPPSANLAAQPNGWSLGDLLARASTATEPRRMPPDSGPHAASTGAPVNLEVIASALDADTAAAIWSRFRAGQRGIMDRAIYSADGRNTFDEVVRRYASEQAFRGTVDTFLADFEALLADSEARDASGRTAESHLASASGRTYLFLAHASGRLS